MYLAQKQFNLTPGRFHFKTLSCKMHSINPQAFFIATLFMYRSFMRRKGLHWVVFSATRLCHVSGPCEHFEILVSNLMFIHNKKRTTE